MSQKTPETDASLQTVCDGVARQICGAADEYYLSHFNPTVDENQLPLALNEYARALEQSPDAVGIVVKMAQTQLRQGLFIKAEQSAKRALTLHEAGKVLSTEALAGAYQVLGIVAYHRDDYEAAKRLLGKSIRLCPKAQAQARIFLFRLERDFVTENWKNPRSLWKGLYGLWCLFMALVAAPFAKERMSLGHGFLLLPQLMQAWFLEEFNRGEQALTHYLKIHQQFPGLPGVTVLIGELYRETGHPEEARHWFEKALERHPDYLNGYYHLARLLEEQENYPQMARVYETIVQMTPHQPDAHCHLGNAYYYMNDFTQAVCHYATALQLGKDNHWKAMVAQSMANIHADYLRNAQAAIAYYDMASVLNPEDVENYIQMGLLYFQKEDFANAESVYLKAIKANPKMPKLYSNLGYLRWMANDVERAIAYYKRAIELDDTYEIPINNLGVIHLDLLGEVDSAIGYFQQAIAINDSYALAYYNLGRAYSFLGNRLDAAHCFKTAQALNLESKDLDNDELSARIHSLFDSCEIELLD
ncbi:tetratricopeptide repeat protein [Vampirovibrio chlorellavorus]|uniref:tetratricopeptide repeat protein n=1 Tax=Vampirovibrio chlorellavorus TaxID=758823 RepID=UPI0026EDE7EA|nr:tetratricopeptide repeat protein [Vampirovibrio chlorellavorus]